jgi:hypothetical protein
MKISRYELMAGGINSQSTFWEMNQEQELPHTLRKQAGGQPGWCEM